MIMYIINKMYQVYIIIVHNKVFLPIYITRVHTNEQN